MPDLAMFPLGTVLFPHMVLPLHVFEPRYRALMLDVLADGGAFGVVLIERGHEVGGGDVRSDIGTEARIVQAEELDDGRWLTIAVGARRFRIESWLPDAPYPMARVSWLDETHVADDAVRYHDEVVPLLRRVLALETELGRDGVPSTFELPDDPTVGCWQAAVLSPLGPFDAQRVLAIDRCGERLARLDALLNDLEQTLTMELSDGS